jgi:uncharacterized protein YijF (DUF1287 family)
MEDAARFQVKAFGIGIEPIGQAMRLANGLGHVGQIVDERCAVEHHRIPKTQSASGAFFDHRMIGQFGDP